MVGFLILFHTIAGPTVEANMKLSLLTPRDTETNIMFTLSFTVSFGPPTEISCSHNSIQFFSRANSVSVSPVVSREVIRSHYINSSYPDMTRVVLTQTTPRESSTYSCIVYVTSRTNIGIGGDGSRTVQKGSGTSTASLTGECCTLLTTSPPPPPLPSVASPPTAVMVSRTGINRVLVSWSAPSSAPGGYEVFYQVAGGSTLSGGNTSNTELTLTGLTLGNHSFFVVGYGAEGEPVLPSAHSNTASVIIGEICHCAHNYNNTDVLVDIPQLPSNPTVTPGSTSIMVSWMPPPYSPSNYTVSYSCQLLCNSSSTTQGSVTVSSATTHTFSSLPPGSSCTISVVAVYDGIEMNNTVSSTVNTTVLPSAHSNTALVRCVIVSRHSNYSVCSYMQNLSYQLL